MPTCTCCCTVIQPQDTEAMFITMRGRTLLCRDHTRGLALRLWAENARTPAAPPAARLAIGRILALARDASRPTLRAEALDTLRELIPRAAETAFDLAEEALEAPEPAVQSAGLRLLSALATRCPPEPLAEGEE